jgi:hypothetical protein
MTANPMHKINNQMVLQALPQQHLLQVAEAEPQLQVAEALNLNRLLLAQVSKDHVELRVHVLVRPGLDFVREQVSAVSVVVLLHLLLLLVSKLEVNAKMQSAVLDLHA